MIKRFDLCTHRVLIIHRCRSIISEHKLTFFFTIDSSVKFNFHKTFIFHFVNMCARVCITFFTHVALYIVFYFPFFFKFNSTFVIFLGSEFLFCFVLLTVFRIKEFFVLVNVPCLKNWFFFSLCHLIWKNFNKKIISSGQFLRNDFHFKIGFEFSLGLYKVTTQNKPPKYFCKKF